MRIYLHISNYFFIEIVARVINITLGQDP